jgi:hypothetical protein
MSVELDETVLCKLANGRIRRQAQHTQRLVSRTSFILYTLVGRAILQVLSLHKNSFFLFLHRCCRFFFSLVHQLINVNSMTCLMISCVHFITI